MSVRLLNYTELPICATAIRTCWDSHDKSDNGGPKDRELITRVGNKFKHGSVLEHLNYTFYLTCSRALLQELSRHRHASLSVKSTRYTLKELKNEEPFIETSKAQKYLIFTGIEAVDSCSIEALENVRILLSKNVSNDYIKYALPESYKTELTWTINARSLQNFLQLRSSKEALWEIRDLAHAIYNNIPDEHKYIFKGFINE